MKIFQKIEHLSAFYLVLIYLICNLSAIVLFCILVSNQFIVLKSLLGVNILNPICLLIGIALKLVTDQTALIINKVTQVTLIGYLVYFDPLEDKTCLLFYLAMDHQSMIKTLIGTYLKVYKWFLTLGLIMISIQITLNKMNYESFISNATLLIFSLITHLQKNNKEIEEINNNFQEIPKSRKKSLFFKDKLKQIDQGQYSDIKHQVGQMEMESKIEIVSPHQDHLHKVISNTKNQIHLDYNQQQEQDQQRIGILYQDEEIEDLSIQHQFQPQSSLSQSFDLILKQKVKQKQGKINYNDLEEIYEKVWRKRMDGIPIGILLLNPNGCKINYANTFFGVLFSETLNIVQGFEIDVLLGQMQFKIMNKGRSSLSPGKSSSFSQQLSQRNMSNSLKNLDRLNVQPLSNSNSKKNFHNYQGGRNKAHQSFDVSLKSENDIQSYETLTKLYTLREIIKKLNDGDLNYFVNVQTQTLTTYCYFENKYHLSCKLVIEKSDTIMVIIEDNSQQNQMQDQEEQNKFKTKVIYFNIKFIKMINSFSHELRTPLNGATNFLNSCLLDETISMWVKEQYILPCLSSLKRQRNLINDIIDFSQINGGLFDLQVSRFRLVELIIELTEVFKYEFQLKNMGLAFYINDFTSATISTDYQRLFQILVNLIQNALKFSEKGYILVEIQQENDDFQFNVQDEGIGIAPEKLILLKKVILSHNLQQQDNQEWLGKILKYYHLIKGFGLVITQMLLNFLGPLKQLDIQSDEQIGGTNVSFSILDQIEDQALFDDENEGEFIAQQIEHMAKGIYNINKCIGITIAIHSSFESSLLQKRSNQQQKQVSSLNALNDEPNCKIQLFYQKNSKDHGLVARMVESQVQNSVMQHYSSKIGLIQQFTGHNSGIANTSNVESICECRVILSVDDEPFNQGSLKLILGKIGFKIDVAYNGKQAIDMILNKQVCSSQCRRYVLILMDYQMPIMDGPEATRRISKLIESENIKQIPIFGLTAFTSTKDREQCIQSGMCEVLEKPLQMKKFQELLGKYKI